MKNEITELVFILDKSGSMYGLEKDTIGGFNSMLKKQQALEGKCVITTVLFDNDYELLHDRLDIQAVRPLTEKDYQVGSTTALLDAIGLTINKIAKVQKNSAEDYRADKVMFVIITDGHENASREFSLPQIKAMISEEKEKHGWEFIFLGANIDAVETASHFGIDSTRAAKYVPDAVGTALNFAVVGQSVASFRKNGAVSDDGLSAIREDMAKRGKR